MTELFGSKTVGELFLVLNTQCGADPPLKATPPGWISRGSRLKTPKKSDQKYLPSFHVLVELEASRYLQQVPNGVSFLASKEHDSLFLGAFTSLSVLRPASVSAVIAHRQDPFSIH